MRSLAALLAGFVALAMAKRTDAMMDYMPGAPINSPVNEPIYPNGVISAWDRFLTFCKNYLDVFIIIVIVLIVVLYRSSRKGSKNK